MQKYMKKGRVVVALLFFIAFLLAFADIKGNLPTHFYKLFLYFQFTPSVLESLTHFSAFSAGFIVVIVLTILGGRIYCSTICPLGILQDIVLNVKRKIQPKQRLRFKKALNILRYSILGITLISILISGLFLINLLDPYAIFGRIGTHIFQPVFLSMNNLLLKIFPSAGLNAMEGRPFQLLAFMVGAGMLAIVVVFSILRGRLYCNSICPVGSFLGLVAKVSLNKIKIESSACSSCGKCQTVCKANCINIKTREVDESRCIACYNCIQVCADSAIAYKRNKINRSAAEPVSDGRRRFFIVSTMAYLASKAIPALASEIEKGDNAHDTYYDRGTVSPPGSGSIEHLKDRCIACNMCISVCPTKVLQPSALEYGFTGMLLPKMDYGVYFCNYDCTKCGEICPTGAILQLPLEEKKITQIGKVQFLKEFCVVETRGKSCGSCSEHCPTQAVKMIPYKEGLTIPQTDTSICIGCGACEYACPVENPHPAIFVVSNLIHQMAKMPVSKKLEYKETEEFPF
jgi:ferredoxin